jgi:hypothetical protein
MSEHRFSLRQMAIAIAIIAVTCLGFREFEESYRLAHRAYWDFLIAKHAAEEQRYREMAKLQIPHSRDKQRCLLGIIYHRDLKLRFQKVRDHPWRPVPSDLAINPWTDPDDALAVHHRQHRRRARRTPAQLKLPASPGIHFGRDRVG